MQLLEGEDQLLATLAADVDDESVRAVYADWLEERGDPRATWLRAEAELHRLLTAVPKDDAGEPRPPDATAVAGVRERLAAVPDVEPDWAAVVTRMPIENCDVWSRMVRMRFRCPERWHALERTMSAGVRFCGACRRHVFYSPTIESAQLHARAGNCVAVAPNVPREAGDLDDVEMLLGMLEEENGIPDGLDRDTVRPFAQVFRAVQRVLMRSSAPPVWGDGAEEEAPESDPEERPASAGE